MIFVATPSSKRSPRGKTQKQRIDRLLVSRGMAKTREKAQALILSGAVVVTGQERIRPGTRVAEDAPISIRQDPSDPIHRFVGRGGLKLEGALTSFGIDVQGKTVADFGASTGGFTDCLLQKGARHVYAIDVGYGQIDWKLRKDPRVSVLDRVNIRYMDPGDLADPVELVTIDLSFISITKVLAKAGEILADGGSVLALVKPQFEVGKGEVGKGGIIREQSKQKEALERVIDFSKTEGWIFHQSAPSQITGQKGNQEYFIYLSLPVKDGKG